MKSKKNAFTLIELLAIIVILAIIAVITVPIILNIIENSKRGAATDSAYGYKDSVNKYYVSKLSENPNYTLSGVYDPNELENMGVLVSGTKPTEGWIKLEKGKVIDYSLKFGDYTVNLDIETNTPSATKNGELKDNPANNCPGPNCVYAFYYTRNSKKIGDELQEYSSSNTEGYVKDYTVLNKNYFLGHILENGIIKKIYTCGIEGDTLFCLKGFDTAAYKSNQDILKQVYNCTIDYEEDESSCSGLSSDANVKSNGYVYVHTIQANFCRVNNSDEGAGCN